MKRHVSIRQLFAAGLFAGGMQSIAVALIVVLFRPWEAAAPALTRTGVPPVSPISDMITVLRVSDLVVALGLALTRNHCVDTTAACLRQASRHMFPNRPESAVRTLLAQLAIAAIGFVVLAMGDSPFVLAQILGLIGCTEAAPLVWTGILSIAAAAFGANAYAAARAVGHG